MAEENQIDEIAASLIKIFYECALPFFTRYDSLRAIESAINININDTSLTGSIFKGSKGIILAKLLDKDTFNKLSILYLKYYEKLSDGFYLPEYNNLLDFLKNVVFEKNICNFSRQMA